MVAEPAVPPTPPVRLAALLAREDLALRQLAGPPAADVAVHWAQVSEMSDPYPYLLGGELLLTAGVHIPQAAGSGTYFDDYVARIVAAGGAALGFGVAPVHDTVPRALVAACETYGLPLVEVEPRTTFAAVARAVWRLVAEARTAELRRVAEAQRSLAAAASRPDAVPSVLRKLATLLAGRAVLYGPGGTEVASAGREPGKAADRAHGTGAGHGPGGAVGRRDGAGAGREPGEAADRAHGTGAGHGPGGAVGAALAGLARFVGERGSSTATDTVGGVRLAAYALGAGPDGPVLGVAAPDREPGDHTIASLAAVLLSLLTGERHRTTDPETARTSALVRLLLGAPPAEVAPLLAAGEHGYVVHARPAGRAPDPVAAAALGAALGSALVDVAGDVVRVLLPDGPEPAPQPRWTLGVSAPAGPAQWPAADTQAARALARARATRAPLVRHGARPVLADLVPGEEAAAHARAVLAPLAAHPALIETLRTWLSLHGNWDRTAVALSVHRNTVRQRVARCAALLERDLDDPDVRMELWFALRHR